MRWQKGAGTKMHKSLVGCVDIGFPSFFQDWEGQTLIYPSDFFVYWILMPNLFFGIIISFLWILSKPRTKFKLMLNKISICYK